MPEVGGKKKIGRCPLCGNKCTLVPDHDHEIMKFRAWICGICNRALGVYEKILKDGRLEKFEAYLKKYRRSR
jgi:hypothetical protein